MNLNCNLNCPYPLEKIFPKTEFDNNKKYAVHFYITHGQVTRTFEWIKKQPLEVLQRSDSKYGLTPLHLAVIKNEKILAEFLLEKGVPLTTVDKQGYTVLHHATICQNHEMLEWIHTVDKTAKLAPMLTHEKKTAENLKEILSYTPFKPSESAFNYFDPESNQVIRGSSAEKFFSMTHSIYTEHTIVTPKSLVYNWMNNDTLLNSWPEHISEYIQKKYQNFKEKPPFLYLAKNPIEGVGYDVHAGEEIGPFQIACIYHGQGIAEDPKDASYWLGNVDGTSMRNLGPMINDGPPLLLNFDIVLEDEAGFSSVFITSRKILKGERLTYNYGNAHYVKWNRHFPLNNEGIEESFRSQSPLKKYIELLETIEIQKKMGSNDISSAVNFIKSHALLEELKYILSTYSSLYYLFANEIIEDNECVKLILFDLSNDGLLKDIQFQPLVAFSEAKNQMKKNNLLTEFNQFVLEILPQRKIKSISIVLKLMKNIKFSEKTWKEDSKQLFLVADWLDRFTDMLFLDFSNEEKKLEEMIKELNQYLNYKQQIKETILSQFKDTNISKHEILLKIFSKVNKN